MPLQNIKAFCIGGGIFLSCTMMHGAITFCATMKNREISDQPFADNRLATLNMYVYRYNIFANYRLATLMYSCISDRL